MLILSIPFHSEAIEQGKAHLEIVMGQGSHLRVALLQISVSKDVKHREDMGIQTEEQALATMQKTAGVIANFAFYFSVKELQRYSINVRAIPILSLVYLNLFCSSMQKVWTWGSVLPGAANKVCWWACNTVLHLLCLQGQMEWMNNKWNSFPSFLFDVTATSVGCKR